MPHTTSIRRIGNSLGSILPREILDRMHLSEGDTLFVAETAYGLLLTPFESDVKDALEHYASLASRYRETLRSLAK
jgi:putative addiction module antidote